MNENLRDENHWTDPETGNRYRAETDIKGCEGCGYGNHQNPYCPHRKDGPECSRYSRSDRRGIIWVRDDQPPAPVLTLTPPVDALDLARMLTSLRPGARLTVSVEGGSIVVREAVQ